MVLIPVIHLPAIVRALNATRSSNELRWKITLQIKINLSHNIAAFKHLTAEASAAQLETQQPGFVS